VQGRGRFCVLQRSNTGISDSTGARGYQIQELARLTGLTVRAHQH
jgi:hypothetical protein